jgi:hypothetical protein
MQKFLLDMTYAGNGCRPRHSDRKSFPLKEKAA